MSYDPNKPVCYLMFREGGDKLTANADAMVYVLRHAADHIEEAAKTNGGIIAIMASDGVYIQVVKETPAEHDAMKQGSDIVQ